MIRKLYLVLFFTALISWGGNAQSFIKTSDLFKRSESNYKTGRLNIIQNPAIDTLISRYILANANAYKEHDYYGMEGFRIQIFSSPDKNAKEESNKARADFMSKFPDIVSYQVFAKPGWFKIRVGDFRTKMEAYGMFVLINKEFPDAYIVPDFIHFPDLNKK